MACSQKRGHSRHQSPAAGREKLGKRTLRKHSSLLYEEVGVRLECQCYQTNPKGKSYLSGVPVG